MTQDYLPWMRALCHGFDGDRLHPDSVSFSMMHFEIPCDCGCGGMNLYICGRDKKMLPNGLLKMKHMIDVERN
jgi:hypothetical protein